MEALAFHDGNISQFIDNRTLNPRFEINQRLQMHSAFIRRLSLEKELEGHQGCVNAIAWNSRGSLLVSGSDDTQINIWSYPDHNLVHSIETGHSANIFCTKFVPETSDEVLVSGAGDAEVRLFNISHLKGGHDNNAIQPSGLFQCHTRRVKKLAVEVGNPNVVWSASEDGTLRQHDIRESASCPPAGSSHQECRNILLDLRCGAKRSLSEPPKQSLALKSCDISSTRPHLLLVGGSDAFARLYDRRMLPPMSSSQNKLPPPPCVAYFCPVHLSDHRRSSLHLTHVTFSPNSEEILLSYSGEHVYLMDVNTKNGSSVQYTSGDVVKLMNFTPLLNGVEFHSSNMDAFSNAFPVKGPAASRLRKCRELIQFAEKSLKEEANYHDAISACNEVMHYHGHEIGSELMHDCLCMRAALFLKRQWKNDVHMAIRDCHKARKIYSSSVRAMLCMSEALPRVGKLKEALDFATAAQSLAPSNFEIAEKVESIRKDIATAEAEKNSKVGDGGSKSRTRSTRVLSLSDILYRSEVNSDVLVQEGQRSEREDSDYDDELELDFETSLPDNGDQSLPDNEGHDVEPNVLHGSLNLRIHRRGDSGADSGQGNGSSEPSMSSSQNDRCAFQAQTVVDMKQRYVGHCNVGTDIKQASFLGQKGDYVASGSDDGRWFIWEKRAGRLVKMLHGDEAVVNCIQCHPFDSAVATSGIDATIKIWTPIAAEPSIVAGGAAGPETSNVIDAMEANQRRLSRTREAILPFEVLERFQMHEFAEGSLHPFECTQS